MQPIEPISKPPGFEISRSDWLRPTVAGSGVTLDKSSSYQTQPETADGRGQTSTWGFENTSLEMDL
jgi:hypothetical protein